jgi:hypothetical protein
MFARQLVSGDNFPNVAVEDLLLCSDWPIWRDAADPHHPIDKPLSTASFLRAQSTFSRYFIYCLPRLNLAYVLVAIIYLSFQFFFHHLNNLWGSECPSARWRSLAAKSLQYLVSPAKSIVRLSQMRTAFVMHSRTSWKMPTSSATAYSFCKK